MGRISVNPIYHSQSIFLLFKAYKVIPETAKMPMPKSTAAGNTADPVASKFREYLAAVAVNKSTDAVFSAIFSTNQSSALL